jgi:outer membrane lipase/esterase
MTITRRRWNISALAAAALIVAGCGGGTTDSPLATRVVVFGDSLSDIGTYTPATQIPLGQAAGVPPFFGGKFTTNTFTGYTATSNTSTANIWVEWIAARLGVALTPAEVGFITTRVPCPASARGLSVNSCTGYAQGGSRVTDPNGIGKTGGALTIPIVDQIASHNTRALEGFNTGFGNGDIVFVFGGNNDVLVQFGAASQGLPPADAIGNIVTAASELATLIKDEIIGKGAKRVAVVTLPNLSLTPRGAGLGPVGNPTADGARALLADLSVQFNAALLAELDGSGAKIIDAATLLSQIQASPASYGLTNVTTPACNATIISALTGGRVTDGSSLFCNASPATLFTAAPPAGAGLPNSLNSLTPGASASTYLYADTVHPTTAVHKIFADQVWTKLKDFGWAPDNL